VSEVNTNELFDEMITIRRAFYEKIAVGKNAKWKRGWLNRLEAVKIFR